MRGDSTAPTAEQRQDGLYLVLLGCTIFLLIGPLVEKAMPAKTIDYRPVYFSTRCFLEHRDPYNADELRSTIHDEGGESWEQIDHGSLMERKFIYLPTVFAFSAPFALFPFALSKGLWLAGMAAAYISAAMLIWRTGARAVPVAAGALVALALGNSELFFALGNPAGYAIALCIVAVYCFVNERYVALGVMCMALSLMLKPHDGWLIWLFFFLAGGRGRRYAIWTAGAVAVMIAPIVWELYCISPHWLIELRAIFAEYAAPGSVNDPGPTGTTALSTVMIASLQPVFSLLSDRPAFYNGLSYFVCGALLLPWCWRVVRTRPSVEGAWMAIAPASLLALLPVYHRSYDARLLLLAIPGCMLLWKRNPRAGQIGSALLAAGTLVTAGIPWSIFAQVAARHAAGSLLAAPVLRWLVTATVPLTLLGAGVFFLLAYLCEPRVRGASSMRT